MAPHQLLASHQLPASQQLQAAHQLAASQQLLVPLLQLGQAVLQPSQAPP